MHNIRVQQPCNLNIDRHKFSFNSIENRILFSIWHCFFIFYKTPTTIGDSDELVGTHFDKYDATYYATADI